MSHLISFSRYQTKCVKKFLIRQFITSQTKIFLESTSKAMVDREKKEGKTKIQKFQYLENEKSFCNEIKTFFTIFDGLSFGEK